MAQAGETGGNRRPPRPPDEGRWTTAPGDVPGPIPLWAGLLTPLVAPLLFPPVVLLYAGAAFAEPFWVRCGFVIFSLTVLLPIDAIGRRAVNANLSRARSALAAHRAASVSDRPAALILRPFRKWRSFADPEIDFSLLELIEPELTRAGLQPVALGSGLPAPPRHTIAFVETTEDDWWAAFECLSSAAAVIVLFGDDTPSLQREIDAIASDTRRTRTVLLMMPTSLKLPLDQSSAAPAGDDAGRAEAWEATRRSLARHHICLPHYDGLGAVVRLRSATEPQIAGPLRRRGWRHGLKTVASALVMPFDLHAHYRLRHNMDLGACWREATAQLPFSGPPTRSLWAELAVPPLRIDLSTARWSPPGAFGGDPREELAGLAVIGWGLALITVLLAWLL